MSTVVDLSDDVLAEIKKVTNENDPSVAIRTAAVEYLRYMKRMQLIELSGRVEMEDNLREPEPLHSGLKLPGIIQPRRASSM